MVKLLASKPNTSIVSTQELKERIHEVFLQLQSEQLKALEDGQRLKITDAMVARRYRECYSEYFAVDQRALTREQAFDWASSRAIAAFKKFVGVRANGTPVPAWVETDSHGQWWIADIILGLQSRDVSERQNAKMLAQAAVKHMRQRSRAVDTVAEAEDMLFQAALDRRLTTDSDGNYWWEAE